LDGVLPTDSETPGLGNETACIANVNVSKINPEQVWGEGMVFEENSKNIRKEFEKSPKKNPKDV
jgi:hypothetical protein